MSVMKRNREDFENLASLATSLVMMSQGASMTQKSSTERVFECKTCNRQFQSFQALGGHRASHKKPRDDSAQTQTHDNISSPSKKLKAHECSICGLEFAIGQALGGHMRRHRAAMMSTTATTTPPRPQALVPVFKRSNSKRVFSLDLNLTPLENDLEFPIMNRFEENIKSPMIHCFI